MLTILFFSLTNMYSEIITEWSIIDARMNPIYLNNSIDYKKQDEWKILKLKNIHEIQECIFDIIFNITAKYWTPFEVIGEIFKLNYSSLCMISWIVSNILWDGFESVKILIQNVNISKILFSLSNEFCTKRNNVSLIYNKKYNELYLYLWILSFISCYCVEFEDDNCEVKEYYYDIIKDHIEIFKSIIINETNLNIIDLNWYYLIIQTLDNFSQFHEIYFDSEMFNCIKNVLSFFWNGLQNWNISSDWYGTLKKSI